MKEQILEIIEKHNKVITTIESLDIEVSLADLLKLQSVSSALSGEGLAITHFARENGINAKCNMQSGLISVYGDL